MATQQRSRQVFQNVIANAQGTQSPLPKILLGAALIGFWIVATVLQIQTSEAFLLHGPAVSLSPDWSILTQPYDLVRGFLKPEMAKATLWGWGMELVFLVCVIGFDVAHASIHASSQRLAGWFKTGLVILVAIDAWSDFQYGNMASGIWGQIAFAAITAFVVCFFGLIGLRFIESGISDWSR